MKIHKAGYSVIAVIALIQIALWTGLFFLTSNHTLQLAVGIAFLLLLCFVVRFFRSPKRNIEFSADEVIAPADGKVVVIEEITDSFTGEKRMQLSIFMSVWNVHINWLPVLGKIVSAQHFSGNYMRAILPKSSEENERAVTLIEPKSGKGTIVVKQIAGAVARRIITYVKANDHCEAGKQLGFIRFGSRVDILLPSDYVIDVHIGDKTTGGITRIAHC